MYCNNCRSKLSGVEKYCPNCGNLVNGPINIDNGNGSTENYRTASIILGGLSIGGVLLVVFAPISLILSIIGLILALKANKNSKNTAGLVLNGIGLFLSFILTAIFALLMYIVIDVIKNGTDEYGNRIYDYIEEQRIPYDDNRF